MRNNGRPTKLNSETQQRIVTAIEQGATYEHAANYGGIASNTFNEWRKRGEAELTRRDNTRVQEGTAQWDNEQPFVEFYEAVKKAEGNAVLGWLTKIELAATNGNWQAAAWKLERRYPREYGRNVIDMNHGGGLQIEFVYPD